MGVDVYHTIWIFIHLLFNIKDFFTRLYFVVKTKCLELIRVRRKTDLFQDKYLIEENKGHLKKVPVHLAVVLGTEDPDFEALSKIVFWGLAAGIQHISFYDHQGKYSDWIWF